MEKQDIVHLASLARISIADEEANSLQEDINSVLSYVGTINEIAADAHLTKKVGAVHNVFRDDVVTNEGNANTETLLNEAPHVKGRYLQVKKILQQD